MPTYDYLCLACGNRFERFQGINEEPLESCPECRGIVKRMISGGGGFIIKGGKSVDSVPDKASMKPSCGRETTCCGSEFACGKSGECR